jgi:hypothetical protein
MNVKKYMVGAIVGATFLSGALMVSAQETSISMKATIGPVSPNASKMVLEVGPQGKVLLRGTVDVVNTNSLTVKSWGGSWVINVAPSATLVPGSGIGQFKVGDFVGVQGIVNQSSAWTIDATLIRDWTLKVEAKTNLEDIHAIKKAEKARNWEGVASNVNSDAKTFTLTVEGVAYTVNIAADAKIVNQRFLIAGFADIKNGDKVRVYGPSADMVITASVVRDISI